MKRVTKLLAALLVLVLVIGAIPVQAASTPSLKKSSKVLYLGGCKGTKANGTKAKFYESVKASKLLKGFKSSTMDIKLESSNEKVVKVSNSNGTITAVGRGTAKVMITVRNKSTEKTIFAKEVKITVKKNADADFSVTGIKDGAEYEVGKSLTVVLTRKSDDDYRKLSVDNKGVTLTKKNKYGSKYTVKFTEAGTYTFTAIAYQSSTYAGATAKKTFTVTVKGAAPTPTVTPTATPTPTTAPSNASIKQTTLNTFVISGVENAADLKAKDLKKTYKVSGYDIEKTGVSSVTADGTDLTVSMLSDFDAGVEYFVNYTGYNGTPLSFKSATFSVKDIASITVSNQRVLTGQNADLGVRYLNKDGVDITSGVSSLVIPTMTIVEGGISDLYVVSGTQVYFLNANKTAVLEISVMTGVDELGKAQYITQKVAVTSYEPQYSSFIWTVTSDDGAYMKKDDPQNHSFTIDTTSPVLEGYFVYKDEKGNETYKTFTEEGITKILVADQTVVMDGVKTAAGGWGLIPNKTGATSILLYKGDRAVAEAQITILGAKQANALTVTASKQTLNVNSVAGDSIVLTAVVKDQYGNELKGQTINVVQNDLTKNIGTVALGAFDSNGKLTIPGGSVALNTGITNGVIALTVTCGSGSATVQFQVADFAEANVWTLASYPEASLITIDTAIKQGDAAPGEARFAVEGRNGAFSVKKEVIQFFAGKQPTAQLKASDLGIAVGTKIYIFTVQKDGQFLSALPAPCITNTSTELVFKAFDVQTKLEAGNYVIAAYSIVGGAENSQITAIGTRTVVVTNNQAPVQFKQIKDKSTAVTGIDVAKECFEFYVDGKKLDSSCIIDADVNFSGTGSKYVKSVKLSYNNTIYGDYVQNVSITGSVIN